MALEQKVIHIVAGLRAKGGLLERIPTGSVENLGFRVATDDQDILENIGPVPLLSRPAVLSLGSALLNK